MVEGRGGGRVPTLVSDAAEGYVVAIRHGVPTHAAVTVCPGVSSESSVYVTRGSRGGEDLKRTCEVLST